MDQSNFVGDDGIEHIITARIEGKATLEELPRTPQDPGEWSNQVEQRQMYKCSCGAHLEDENLAVFNHLKEEGVL